MFDAVKILAHYLRFRHTHPLNEFELRSWQNQMIQKQLLFIQQNSPFYQQYAGASLTELPIMDKTKMMAHFNDLNTVGLDRDEAKAFATQSERTGAFAPKLKGITIGLSSGTSGNQGIFLISEAEKVEWAGYILAHFLPNPIWRKNVVAFFMRANSNLYEAIGSQQIKFIFCNIFSGVETYLSTLNKEQPNLLVGQPSVLLELAQAQREKRLQIKPQKVISIAEVLEAEDAMIIKEAFAVSVVHQVYQCTEGLLAKTCDYGTLHINEDIVFIEEERIDEERFIPIITDFRRRAQPIIRYRLNDILVKKQTICPCGSPHLALAKIEGREDDVFFFESEQGFVKIYPDFIRRCLLFVEGITAYRVVQINAHSVTIYIDAEPETQELIRTEFDKLAKARCCRCPDITFEAYQIEKGRKLKRVASHFSVSVI